MIPSASYKFLFSTINWASSSSQILSSLKKEIKMNPSFIKDNGIFITNHIADMINKSTHYKKNNRPSLFKRNSSIVAEKRISLVDRV